MNRMVGARGLGAALVKSGVLHERTTTAEIVIGLEGALMIRSERYITDDELPKIAKAIAALAKELG